MNPLPQAITDYWNNNANLPKIWYEFAPESTEPPISIFYPEGFNRSYQNIMNIDRYRYRFEIHVLQAESAWDLGFLAVKFMDDFSFPTLINVMPEPNHMATPSQVGQANVWKYEFSVNFEIRYIQGV